MNTKIVKDPHFEVGKFGTSRTKNRRIIVNIPDGKDYVIILFVRLGKKEDGEDSYITTPTTRYRCRRGMVHYTYVKISIGTWLALSKMGLEFVSETLKDNPNAIF